MPNNKNKPAMSLLTILASMIVVMIALVVATPVITKRLHKISSGRNIEGTVNLNSSKGYFMCYMTSTGQLMQIEANILANGSTTIKGPTSAQNGCNFDIPSRAESFKITLIGGGGGGAGTSAEIFTYEIAQDSIDFGINGTTLTPFQQYKTYITSQASAIKELLGENYLNLQFIISGATAKGQINKEGTQIPGTAGAICKIPFITAFIDTSTTAIKYSSGNKEDTIGKLTPLNTNGVIRKTIYAYPGQSPVQYGNDYLSFTDCYSIGTSCKKLLNLTYANSSNSGIGACTSGTNIAQQNEIYYSETQTGTTPYIVSTKNNVDTTIVSIPLSLNRNALRSYIAEGGAAGEVRTFETAFLAPLDATSITIPKNSIGAGGRGGTTSCNINNPTGCNGVQGGTTSLTLTTNSGEVKYSASGGLGGKTNTKEIVPKKSDSNTGTISEANGTVFNGGNGTIVQYSLPNSILAKLNIENTATGALGSNCNSPNANQISTTNCNGICSGSGQQESCNGNNAAQFGTGGGGAAIAMDLAAGGSPKITSSMATNFIYPNKSDTTPAKARFRSGNGGQGAPGAIIIEW